MDQQKNVCIRYERENAVNISTWFCKSHKSFLRSVCALLTKYFLRKNYADRGANNAVNWMTYYCYKLNNLLCSVCLTVFDWIFLELGPAIIVTAWNLGDNGEIFYAQEWSTVIFPGLNSILNLLVKLPKNNLFICLNVVLCIQNGFYFSHSGLCAL